jgi:hypothetical protein
MKWWEDKEETGVKMTSEEESTQRFLLVAKLRREEKNHLKP